MGNLPRCLRRLAGRGFINSLAVGNRNWPRPIQTKDDVMKINKKTMIGSVGLALMLSSGVLLAADTAGQRGQFTSSDFKFVTDATQGGMEEVQLGELAKQKAANPAVREFGE